MINMYIVYMTSTHYTKEKREEGKKEEREDWYFDRKSMIPKTKKTTAKHRSNVFWNKIHILVNSSLGLNIHRTIEDLRYVILMSYACS